MTEIEKVIDQLGNAVFRVETNFSSLTRNMPVSFSEAEWQRQADLMSAIQADLETLKVCKADLTDKLECLHHLYEVTGMVMDIKLCLMFDTIRADFAVKEVLDRHNVPSVQLLAKKAEDLAEHILCTDKNIGYTVPIKPTPKIPL